MITARWYQRITDSQVCRLATHLRDTQFWPPERIRQYQFEKLKRLLEHACLSAGDSRIIRDIGGAQMSKWCYS